MHILLDINVCLYSNTNKKYANLYPCYAHEHSWGGIVKPILTIIIFGFNARDCTWVFRRAVLRAPD